LLNGWVVGDYCKFDSGIVRGLAYYTGIVYEIYDKASDLPPRLPTQDGAAGLRAIGGGGRYDDLLKQFGGPAIPATGFGIGDCVLGILLEEKGLLKPKPRELDYFVAYVNENYKGKAVELALQLRTKGRGADFSYKASKLGKQLKLASDRGAKQCIIIGEEFNNNQLVVKDMTTGEQKTIEVDKFFTVLRTPYGELKS
jgi:histidyl-tRNA synthetase